MWNQNANLEKKFQKISNEFQGQYFGHQDVFISNKIGKIQT